MTTLLFWSSGVIGRGQSCSALDRPVLSRQRRGHTLHFLASLSSSAAILPTPLRRRIAERQSPEQPDWTSVTARRSYFQSFLLRFDFGSGVLRSENHGRRHSARKVLIETFRARKDSQLAGYLRNSLSCCHTGQIISSRSGTVFVRSSSRQCRRRSSFICP